MNEEDWENFYKRFLEMEYRMNGFHQDLLVLREEFKQLEKSLDQAWDHIYGVNE